MTCKDEAEGAFIGANGTSCVSRNAIGCKAFARDRGFLHLENAIIAPRIFGVS
jgi:hypothetical protein